MHERVVVGLNVVRLRRQKGISQEELALVAKRTRAYMSGLETGKRNPTVDTLRTIARALGVTVRELFDDVPPEVARSLRQETAPRRRRATARVSRGRPKASSGS